MPGQVFLTVGTTSFDKLIEAASSVEVCNTLKALGYEELILQTGRGTYEPTDAVGRDEDFKVSHFQFVDIVEFKKVIGQASLIISHAGAGSVLHALGAGKPLVVVINEELMHNHQLEVANQLHKDGHLFYCTPSDLNTMLASMDITALKPYTQGEPQKFANYLDKVMGIA